MDDFLMFVQSLLSLVPVVAFAAPLISILIDGAKRAGLPDGYAPLASLVLNFAAYAAVYFVEADAVAGFVEVAQQLAPYVISLVVGLLASERVHKALREIGVGYSHPADGKPNRIKL